LGKNTKNNDFHQKQAKLTKNTKNKQKAQYSSFLAKFA
jgi:hypothetical protein